MQVHWDVTMVHVATYTLYTMANAILCSWFQIQIQILWEPTSFACLSNCWYFNFYKCQFPSNFCIQQFEMMYDNMPRHKKFFQSSKKKLTKDKVIPIHSQQNRVLDMANFETNFFSNHN